MKLRTLIFWPHLIAGVLAGTVIVVMSVTGVLLTYERQIIAWSDRDLKSVPPSADAVRLPVEALLAAVQRERPDLEPTAITINSAPDATALLATREGNVHADVYTGRLLGSSPTGVRRFMSEMRAWHRWLAVEGEGRLVARAITGWSNVLFLFIVMSGAYLWLPRRWSWQQLRSIALFNGKVRGKARDFNWHNVIGVWSVVPLFIIVLSAVPISFPWGNALVYRAVGEDPPVAAGRGGGPGGRGRQGDARRDHLAAATGLDGLVTRAGRLVPGWRTINLRLPASEREPVVFAIDRGNGGQPHLRSTLTLDRTGQVVRHEDFASLTLGRRVRNTMRFAHTGEVLGIPGQTIAGLATFGSVVLAWTGLALALRRFRAWMRRHESTPAARADGAAA